MGQIHDSIVASVYPPEKEMVLNTFKDIMCYKIKEAHPWLIVDLEAEFEITGIDQPWSTKKKIKWD
jgi:hypothetical protein